MLCKAECTRDEMQERVHCRAATRFLQQKATVQIPLSLSRALGSVREPRVCYNINSLLIIILNCYFSLLNHYTINRRVSLEIKLRKTEPECAALPQFKSLMEDERMEIQYSGPLCGGFIPFCQLPCFSSASLSSLFYFPRRASLGRFTPARQR